MEQNKQTVMAELVALREDLAAQIAKMIVSQPQKSYPVIAKEFGVSRSTVIAAAHKYDVTRRANAPETTEGIDGHK